MSDEGRPRLAVIVAMARNRVIGKQGTLPWHIPEDLKHFKRVTTGHAVIMGRRTYESIGHPLAKRRNIVVTRDESAAFSGCETASSLNEAVEEARSTDDCPFVIGGASLYEEALPRATELHITAIDRDVEGDTYFPAQELSEFELIENRAGDTPDVTFLVYRRR